MVDGSKGLFLLRVLVGLAFFWHGIEKLLTGLSNVAGMFGMMGLPLPMTLAWLAMILEIVIGAALVLGAWARPVAWLGILEMLVAMFTVHWAAGFSFMNVTGMTGAGMEFGPPGWEVNLLYIAAFLCIGIEGPGAWAWSPGGDREIPAPPPPASHVTGGAGEEDE